MKIKKEILLNVFFTLFFFYVFFNLNFYVQTYALWGLGLLFVAVELLYKKKVFCSFSDFIILSFPVIMIFASLYSPLTGRALKFSLTFLLVSLVCVLLSKENKNNINEKYLFNLIIIFSGVHVFSTLFYQLFPELWQQILPAFLSKEDFLYNIERFNIEHINCGLTPIQSANAIYISAFIMCCFIGVFKYSKKYAVFFVLGFIALLLTSKRGLLLAVVVASVIFYSIYVMKKKKYVVKSYFKFVSIILIISVLGFLIVQKYFPDAFRIFARFQQEDFTTGRTYIYNLLLDEYFNGNKIWGNGLFFSRSITMFKFGEENDAHNIYLQILTELGFVGFVSFVLILICITRKIKRIENFDSVMTMFAVFNTLVFLIYGIVGNPLFDLTIMPFWYLLNSFLFMKKRN